MKLPVIFSYILLLVLITVSCKDSRQNDHNGKEFETPVYKWGNITGRTITIWGDKTDINRSYLKKIFARYEEFTGNKIIVSEFSKQEMEETFPQIFNSDSAPKPDILGHYGGANIEKLSPEKNFYDFTEAIWVDDLSNTSLNQAIYEGKVIGLPYGEASISGTLYNKEIFRKYELKVPQNQEEFLDVSQKLLDHGVIPLYMPYAEISMLLYQFPMDSIFKNQNILDDINSNKISYSDIPQMKTIVKWYKTMEVRGFLGPDYIKNDWNGMNDALKSGKYAMMLGWDTWLYTDFDGNPSKFGIMPAFMGTPENGVFEGPNIQLMIVNKNSPNLDVVLDLITFMADPFNYNQVFKNTYTTPIFNNQTGSISTPQYAESERLIEKYFYDSTSWLRITGFSQVDAVYIQKHMRDKQYSAEEALKDMDAARKKRIERYRK